ncbi:uncharacterized protein LOC122403358 [Colletes gigas]|uniref:uncharacterized protein LOC122403358 n=1 Tax=Colletes gigas TaxID=935657 RepID=UPI001C9B353D|nr:uncharacterized protein LOC122403358 [Colletes gigas]
MVEVYDRERRAIECRTLIDTCSSANFMTEALAAKLNLPLETCAVKIEVLNQEDTTTNNLLTATVKSRTSNFKRTLKFFTVPRIANRIPDQQIDRARIPIPKNVKLADPQFHRPAPVDMLISAGPTMASLSIGQLNLSSNEQSDLILQKTQFGWVIGGSGPTATARAKHRTFFATPDFDLQKFWELEEGPHIRHLSAEEQDCEDHFKDHIKRDKSGRYVVALPFNGRESELGESRSRALTRYLSLERKFNRDAELKREYVAVIKDYLELGHMSEVNEASNTDGFYLPHHAVVKSSSTTTKVRVVFDGSAKSSSGLSLNDGLMTGPTIQDDLFALLMRFRTHNYVLTGDIEKMYRQFLVRPEDRRYQQILWRDDDGRIKAYELNTVTFGLSSAPYLAVRCLQQLAEDESSRAPIAAKVVTQDLYVDDLLTGANTYAQALHLRDSVIDLLKRGGLNIRQWVSNDPRLLTGLPTEQIHPKFFGDSSIKTLGLSWDARNDEIVYTVDLQTDAKITK